MTYVLFSQKTWSLILSIMQWAEIQISIESFICLPWCRTIEIGSKSSLYENLYFLSFQCPRPLRDLRGDNLGALGDCCATSAARKDSWSEPNCFQRALFISWFSYNLEPLVYIPFCRGASTLPIAALFVRIRNALHSDKCQLCKCPWV